MAEAGQGDQLGLCKTDLDTLVSTLEVRGNAHATRLAVGPDGEVVARIETFDHGKSWRVMKGADGGDFNPPREIDLATGAQSAPLIDGATAEPLPDRAGRLTIGLRVGGFVDDAVFVEHLMPRDADGDLIGV